MRVEDCRKAAAGLVLLRQEMALLERAFAQWDSPTVCSPVDPEAAEILAWIVRAPSMDQVLEHLRSKRP